MHLECNLGNQQHCLSISLLTGQNMVSGLLRARHLFSLLPGINGGVLVYCSGCSINHAKVLVVCIARPNIVMGSSWSFDVVVN